MKTKKTRTNYLYLLIILITLLVIPINASHEIEEESTRVKVFGDSGIEGIRSNKDKLKTEIYIDFAKEDIEAITLASKMDDIIQHYAIQKDEDTPIYLNVDMCVVESTKVNEIDINSIKCIYQEPFLKNYDNVKSNQLKLLYKKESTSTNKAVSTAIIYQDDEPPIANQLFETSSGNFNEPIIEDRDVYLELNITDYPNPGCSGIDEVILNGAVFYKASEIECEKNIRINLSKFLTAEELTSKITLDAVAQIKDKNQNQNSYTWKKEIDFRLLGVRDSFLINSNIERVDKLRTATDVFICTNLSAITNVKPEIEINIDSHQLNLKANLGAYSKYPKSHCTNTAINVFGDLDVNIKASTVDDAEQFNDIISYSVITVPSGPRVSSIKIGEHIENEAYNSKFSVAKLRNLKTPENNEFYNTDGYFNSKSNNRVKVNVNWQGSDFEESELQLEHDNTKLKSEFLECTDKIKNENDGVKECRWNLNSNSEIANNEIFKISYSKTAKDNIGNLFDSINSIQNVQIVNDIIGPELIDSEQIDFNKLNPYISQFSTFSIKAKIKDLGSGIDPESTFINFKSLSSNPNQDAIISPIKCDSINSQSYECEFRYTAQVPAGYYNVSLHAFDTLSNTNSFDIPVTVFEYVNETDWFYFDVEKMVPQAFDRSSLHKASGKIFLFGKIRSLKAGAEIISVETESPQNVGCWADDIPIVDYERFIDSATLRLLGTDENGNTNFQIVVSSNIIKDATPDSIKITCPFRMRGVAGTQVISDLNSEFDKLDFQVSFVNKRSAMLSESVADKIIAEGEDSLFAQKWIGKLSRVINLLKKICHIAETLDRLYSALTKLRPGVYLVATATKGFGGEQLWKTFNKGVEQIRCGVGPLQPNSGTFGFMRKACTIANCKGKHNIIAEKITEPIDNAINKAGEEYGKALDKVTGDRTKVFNAKPTTGSNVDNSKAIVQSASSNAQITESDIDKSINALDKFFEESTFEVEEAKEEIYVVENNNNNNENNLITGNAGAASILTTFNKQSHAGNSLVNALGMKCIGGIIDGLQRKRVIQCEYINCLWEVGKAGGNIAQCDAYKSFANCKFVAGEVSSLVGSLDLFGKLSKKTNDNLKKLPSEKLGGFLGKGGGILKKIQSCKDTLKLSGYVQTEGNPAPVSFQACGKKHNVPPLQSKRALKVIGCGLLEAAMQKKDLKEILFPVQGIKDSLKQIKIEDTEKFCKEADGRVKKSKEIKEYLDDKYIPAKIAGSAAVVDSGRDQLDLEAEFAEADSSSSTGPNN